MSPEAGMGMCVVRSALFSHVPQELERVFVAYTGPYGLVMRPCRLLWETVVD